MQAGERQADVLSRQVSKSSTESQDLAREREVLLDKLRAAEQVLHCLLQYLHCPVYAMLLYIPYCIAPCEHSVLSACAFTPLQPKLL